MRMAKITIALCILFVTCSVQGLENSESLNDRDWIIWRVARYFEEIEEKQIEMLISRCNAVNVNAIFLQEIGIALEASKEWEQKVANIPADSAILSSCIFRWGANLTEIWEDYAGGYIACIIMTLTSPQSLYDQIQDDIKEFEISLNNIIAQVEECADSLCLQGIRELVEGDITKTWNFQLSVLIGQNLEHFNGLVDVEQYCNGLFEVLQMSGMNYYEEIKQCVNESLCKYYCSMI